MYIKKVMAKKQGVVLILSERGKLKTGNVHGTEFIVSWDKIGELLFTNYTAVKAVEERGCTHTPEDPQVPVEVCQEEKEEEYCRWTTKDVQFGGIISTSCDNSLVINPLNKRFDFCPFCKKKIWNSGTE